MIHTRKSNRNMQTVSGNEYPLCTGDRYWAQDMVRDQRYAQSLPARTLLASLGLDSAFLQGGLVTKGSSYTAVNITAAKGAVSFDARVPDDDQTWAVPATLRTSVIKMLVESTEQTDLDISGGTLDGSTVNYIKLRYAESAMSLRSRKFLSGSYNSVVEDSFQFVVNSTAPTEYDVCLASFVGNGTSTLTITQRYPDTRAGYLQKICANLGFSYDETDNFLEEKIAEAERGQIGDLEFSLVGADPVTFSEARSSTNPSNAKYNPRIPIFDADHDVSTTQVSALDVAAFRAKLFKVGSGTTPTSSFSCTLASGVLTMPSTTAGYAMVSAMQEMGLVNRWYNSNESATYAASGALFTGSRQYCARISGTDYAISSASVSGKTITLSSYPSNGTYTVTFPCFAIAGSTTSFRLRKVSGAAPFASNDYTGEILDGDMGMDRFQGFITITTSYWMGSPLYGVTSVTGTLERSGSEMTGTYNVANTSGPYTNGTNGTPRTGKTTRSMHFGVYPYVKVAALIATSWTNDGV